MAVQSALHDLSALSRAQAASRPEQVAIVHHRPRPVYSALLRDGARIARPW